MSCRPLRACEAKARLIFSSPRPGAGQRAAASSLSGNTGTPRSPSTVGSPLVGAGRSPQETDRAHAQRLRVNPSRRLRGWRPCTPRGKDQRGAGPSLTLPSPRPGAGQWASSAEPLRGYRAVCFSIHRWSRMPGGEEKRGGKGNRSQSGAALSSKEYAARNRHRSEATAGDNEPTIGGNARWS